VRVRLVKPGKTGPAISELISIALSSFDYRVILIYGLKYLVVYYLYLSNICTGLRLSLYRFKPLSGSYHLPSFGCFSCSVYSSLIETGSS